MTKQDKQPRYKSGDIVYVHSHRDGWVQRKVVTVTPCAWEYVLDKTVQIGPDCYVGSEFNNFFHEPASEALLCNLGDLVSLEDVMINRMENPLS